MEQSRSAMLDNRRKRKKRGKCTQPVEQLRCAVLNTRRQVNSTDGALLKHQEYCWRLSAVVYDACALTTPQVVL